MVVLSCACCKVWAFLNMCRPLTRPEAFKVFYYSYSSCKTCSIIFATTQWSRASTKQGDRKPAIPNYLPTCVNPSKSALRTAVSNHFVRESTKLHTPESSQEKTLFKSHHSHVCTNKHNCSKCGTHSKSWDKSQDICPRILPHIKSVMRSIIMPSEVVKS